MSETSTAPADVYRRLILAQVPRLFGLMDRETLSPTAGCADRTYWAWKFVDFPRSRFQEALCVMSFLHATPFEGNTCARHGRLLEWIAMGTRFWSRIQHADGSFDEAYPFERSLAATAFTTFYVGEAYEFVHRELPADVLNMLRTAVARAGDWLVKNDETHGLLSNHLAAAAGALVHAHRITGDDRFRRRSDMFLDRILSRQSKEGWYEEYGGADPGYQTHGSFYLARCAQLTGNDALATSLARSTMFLAHFIHADGSIGGEYASRNTQTYYPAAFEMLAGRDPSASWIAERMRSSVATAAAAGLPGIDSYNYFPFLNNLVFAYLACASGQVRLTPVEPSPEAGLVSFPDAGLARIRTPRYDAYVATSKGGVLKVFNRRTRRLAYADCGYVGRLSDGGLASTQYLDRARTTTVTAERIDVQSGFVQFSRPTLNPFLFVGFRVFTITIGRLPGLAVWLKQQLVKTLVYKQKTVNVSLTRSISFDADRVVVRDRLAGPEGGRFSVLRWASRFAMIHMGSSRYFIDNELADLPDGGDVDLARITTGVELVREVKVPA